jgi:hypothetical protein
MSTRPTPAPDAGRDPHLVARPRNGHGATNEMAREWARRTRAEQGLPFHVNDPGILHRALTIMGRTPATRSARQQSARDPAA